MLADEYILIVPFAAQLQSGLNEQISAAYRNFNFSNSIGLLSRAGRNTEYQHSRKPSRRRSPGTEIVINGKIAASHCVNSTSKTYDGKQWVKAELIVYGNSLIKHIINGDTVLQYSKPQIGGGVLNRFDPAIKQDGKLLSSGFIALQSEGQPVDFRNIELMNLSYLNKK